ARSLEEGVAVGWLLWCLGERRGRRRGKRDHKRHTGTTFAHAAESSIVAQSSEPRVPTMSHVYIHGTEPSEQERLASLNRMTNAAFVEFLNVAPDARVLEVGSGLGILAADVAVAAAGVDVVGIELSAAQIAAALRLRAEQATSAARVTF